MIRVAVGSFVMQICDDVVDLVVAQAPVECGHCALAIDNDLAYGFIGRRSCAVGKIVVGENPVQLGRRLEQAELVFFVAFVAIERVEGLAPPL